MPMWVCIPEHLTLCLALSGHWPEPLYNLLARTPLPTCSLPPASIHDIFLCLRQGEARSNTQSTVPEDRSYSKGHRRHSCCLTADVPLLCRSGGQHPGARSASTTRSHNSTETPTKLTVHFVWQNTSRLVRKSTPSIHSGETLQNQRGSQAKSRMLSTSLSTRRVTYKRWYKNLCTFIWYLFHLLLRRLEALLPVNRSLTEMLREN